MLHLLRCPCNMSSFIGQPYLSCTFRCWLRSSPFLCRGTIIFLLNLRAGTNTLEVRPNVIDCATLDEIYDSPLLRVCLNSSRHRLWWQAAIATASSLETPNFFFKTKAKVGVFLSYLLPIVLLWCRCWCQIRNCDQGDSCGFWGVETGDTLRVKIF